MCELKKLKIIIRGAGDIGSAVAMFLHRARLGNILLTEKKNPTSIRRYVSFSSAIYEGEINVEGVVAKKIDATICNFEFKGFIPVIVDEHGELINKLNPHIIIDAILTKRFYRKYNLDKYFVIGLGPEFVPGKNCNVAVETHRGHNLGRILYGESPAEATGIPGNIDGFGAERILRAPTNGFVVYEKEIGNFVKKGDVVCFVDKLPVIAEISGIVRGLIREGIKVRKNMKIGDIDPRNSEKYCHTISEKARCVAGSVLLAILENFHCTN